MSSYLEDLSQQVEDASEAARGEAWAAADVDWADREDDRTPSRAEAERELFEDWLYDRDRGRT